MSVLALSAVLIGLSRQCAPSVAPGTLLTFAQAESGLDPLALHDNATGGSLQSRTKEQAVALASRLIGMGHSVDLGILQINSRNLPWLGLSVADAFELCPAMRASARILHAAYDPCVDAGGEPQRCLREAASAYNTGTTTRGFENGYVRRIATVAERVIPEIRLATGETLKPSSNRPAEPVQQAAPAARDVRSRPAASGRELVFTRGQ